MQVNKNVQGLAVTGSIKPEAATKGAEELTAKVSELPSEDKVTLSPLSLEVSKQSAPGTGGGGTQPPPGP